MQSFGDLFANNKLFASAALLLALIGVIGIGIALFRLLFGRRLHMSGGRARQPRLGVVDAFDLDRQRQLVLVRRDNVEHLLMIGGPNDVVVEASIVRANAGPLVASSRDKEAGNGAPALPTMPSAPLPTISPPAAPKPEVTAPPAPVASEPPRVLRQDVADGPALDVDVSPVSTRPELREPPSPPAEPPRPPQAPAFNVAPRAPSPNVPPPQRPISVLPPRPQGAAPPTATQRPQMPPPQPPPAAPAPALRPPISRATPLPVGRPPSPQTPTATAGRVEPTMPPPAPATPSDLPRGAGASDPMNGTGERPPQFRMPEAPSRRPDPPGSAREQATDPVPSAPSLSSQSSRAESPARGSIPMPSRPVASPTPSSKPPALGSARTLDALESLEEEMAKLLGRPVTPSDRS